MDGTTVPAGTRLEGTISVPAGTRLEVPPRSEEAVLLSEILTEIRRLNGLLTPLAERYGKGLLGGGILGGLRIGGRDG